MEGHVRAAIAYVAGRAISGRKSGSIFDYSMGSHRLIDGAIQPSSVNVYDYTAGCHFGGSRNGGGYALYHYGENSSVSMDLSGNTFRGYEYGSGSHYTGTVNGQSVSLYDYGTGRFYNYSI